MKSKNVTKVMLAIVLAIIMAGIATADTQVYRLERDTETENLCIVGADGIRRQVCIVEPEEYAMMTGRIEQVWRSLNSTDSGRKSLHGSVVHTTIDSTNGVKTVEYKDGYKFHELMPVKRPTIRATISTNKVHGTAVRTKPSNISQRQWIMRQAREQALKQSPRQVMVEHDAATGSDTIKE